MTTPGAPPPDQAFVLGSAFGSDITETSAKALMKGGTVTSFTNAQNAHNSQVKDPIADAGDAVAEQAGSIVGLDARVTALENGGTRTVYSSNFTWTNPGDGKIFVAVINGGQCGRNGLRNSTTKQDGGIDGGFQGTELLCADLPATVAGTVGAGGSTNAQLGGQSSFGSYVVPVSGAPGSILTAQGAVASASSPGKGGWGGYNSSSAEDPSAGGHSALALGGVKGVRGATIDGQPGQSVSVDSPTPCGGGGGGGGDWTNTIGDFSGSGGAGGAPGGGGGTAGNTGQGNADERGSGGPGGNGRIVIIYTPGAVT